VSWARRARNALDALATSLLDELTEIFVEWESIMGAIHKGDPA
jgi:hypothetical protein